MAITLKAMRVNRGLSQKEAAKMIGVAPSTLSFWENGKSSPSMKHFKSVCLAYRCRAEDIFLPGDLTKS